MNILELAIPLSYAADEMKSKSRKAIDKIVK